MKKIMWLGVIILFLSGCAVERTVYLRQDGTTERVVTTPVPIVIETTPVIYEEVWEPRPIVWVDIHGHRNYGRHHGGGHGRH